MSESKWCDKCRKFTKTVAFKAIIVWSILIVIGIIEGINFLNSRNLSKKADLAMKNKNYKEAISLYGKVDDSEKEKEAQKLYNSVGNFKAHSNK